MNKDLKKLIREAKRQEWRVEPTKKGHYVFLAPDGVGRVTSSGTPSDHRAMQNTISKMRQFGFEWRGR